MRPAVRVALLATAVGSLLAFRPLARHVQAAGLLARFGDPEARSPWLPAPYEVDEASEDVPGPDGHPLATRIYRPVGVARPPGMVLLHGIHRLGLHDPRLIGFARALAGAGVAVMTPEITPLTQYRVDRSGVDFIGDAVLAFAADPRLRAGGVGLVGMSFAGGLALLAAADPRFAPTVKVVLAVGAYDDLERVARFFATDLAQPVEGPAVPLAAHEYGVLVLAHSHPEDFFAPADVVAAREVLLLWLEEEKAAASTALQPLSPAGQQTFAQLREHRGELRSALLASVAKNQEEMASASPHGHLVGLRAPVFLLHGSSDTVIPATELGWLARDLPPGTLRGELVTPLLEHVSLQGQHSVVDYARAIHLLAGVLAAD